MSSTKTRPDCAWVLSDLDAVRQNGITVFSTFACGGGSSMGYKLAGCNVIAANDIDPEMAWHYQKNLKVKHYFLCPIGDLLTRDLPPDVYGVDILDGSPPCSTFSTVGQRESSWGKEKFFREGQAKQVLSDLFFDYLALVDKIRPKVSVAENVKGMIMGNAKGYVRMVFDRYREIGYKPQLFLVNAADCGVPQCRERVFFCALRDDVAKEKLILAPTHRWVSAQEAVQDLRDIGMYKLVTASNQRLTLAGKLKPWKVTSPSPTIVSSSRDELIDKANKFHSWTFAEAKRLGSFPDDYFAKKDQIGKYMIGMSVPPRMTQVVAKAICQQWLGIQDAGG